MATAKLTVTVVGAGIGGLTVAIALRRAGHSVTVYEKDNLSHEIGQGMVISPNGGHILRHLGLDFRKARMRGSKGLMFLKADSLDTFQPPQTERAVEEKYGLSSHPVYRPDLHAALLDMARSSHGAGEAVVLHENSRVKSFEADSGTIVLEDGQNIKADLLVAADGVHSLAARHILSPEPCPDLDSSTTLVYRFKVDTGKLLRNPATAPLLETASGWSGLYVASDRQTWLLRYGCRDNEIQNFALYTVRTPAEAKQQENRVRFETDRGSLVRAMAGFHPTLLRVAEMADEVLPLWRCTTREPLTRFSRGCAVVIGDAANPMLPHLGMGANSAIESAMALGVLMSSMKEERDLSRAVRDRLQLFDELRVPRVAAIKYWSDVPMFRDAVGEQRENVERHLDTGCAPATQADMRSWINGYDVIKAASARLEQYLMETRQHMKVPGPPPVRTPVDGGQPRETGQHSVSM